MVWIASTLLSVVAIHSFAQQKSLQCGQWRWDVKTLTDKDGAALLKAQPKAMEFDRILFSMPPRTLDKKSATDKVQPRFPSEKEVLEFTAYITTINITEDDHDFRIVLKSPGSDNTMLGELPNPDCATFSRFPEQRANFKQTWEQLSAIMTRISGDSKPVKVKITGVRFWDAPTGERGANISGLEIHPVLSVIVIPD